MKALRAFIRKAPFFSIGVFVAVIGTALIPLIHAACMIPMAAGGALMLGAFCALETDDAFRVARSTRGRRVWARPDEDGDRVEICQRMGFMSVEVLASFRPEEDERAADYMRGIRESSRKRVNGEAAETARMLNRVVR